MSAANGATRVSLLAALVLWSSCVVFAGERLWIGGGVGIGFGDVDFVTIEPVAGFAATERLSVGAGVIYRYRNDARFDPDLSTHDYGANLFVRYGIASSLFAQAEYEILDYEYRRFDGSMDRGRFQSLLAGPGYSQPLGESSSFYAMALYNFDHDDDDSPYDEPWIYRVGVAYGF